MISATPVPEFLDLLDRTKILRPEQFEEVINDLQVGYSDLRALAGELIRRKWLTPYQVNQLARGHYDDLVLGSYLLVKRLGRGGMGQVFKAKHVFMNRFVALKIIREDKLSSEDMVSRFRREIQAAAQLVHPNIVRAYDAGQAGARFFLVMEYIKGPTLADLIDQHGRLGKAQTCDYIRQVAGGLQHAYERGVIHRDIKPSNLLLDAEQNVVKILDVGLARFLDRDVLASADTELTRKGMTLGSKDYMAPEQITDARTADVRADLYSLGCTFYHLLTGRPPFPDTSGVGLMVKHLNEEPVPIDELRPKVPGKVIAVVRKLMAKRPEDRYQTPKELLADMAFELFRVPEPYLEAGTR
jgi:serine/threonine-protein kinase